MLLLFSDSLEEVTEHFRTFIFSDTAVNGRFMGIPFLKQIQHTAAGTELFFLCAVHNGWNAGVDDGTCAHGAGLQRDIQCAAFQSPVTDFLACLADGKDLSMCTGIVIFLTAVSAGADDLAVAVGDDAAYGYFTCCGGFLRQHQCLRHIGFSIGNLRHRWVYRLR